MNTAILLSGGIGSRMRSDVPKQYLRVQGKMIATYALEALARSPEIGQIVIVADSSWREAILEDAREAFGHLGLPLEKVAGFADPGASRQESILSGLREIAGLSEPKGADGAAREIAYGEDGQRYGAAGDGMDNGGAVLIHDAARPLLREAQIRECFAALPGHDGVMPVLPMKDTVYESLDGRAVTRLLDRATLFAGQAPELFSFYKYYLANLALLPDRIRDVNGSTEPAILSGMDVAMIPGDEGNFKITTREDLERFETAVAARVASKTVGDS